MSNSQESPVSKKLDFSNLDDPQFLKITLQSFANQLESLHQENADLKLENQKLKDEINRLKGEKGKPDIKPSKPAEGTKAKLERGKKPKKKDKNIPKTDSVKIDDTEEIKFTGELPPDAVRKGYRSLVVQGITIKTNNIEYRLERYYSPSLKKTFEASLPEGVHPGFDSEIQAWVLFWYYQCRMSQNLIHQMLTNIGLVISEGEISNMIIKDHEVFHAEKAEILRAGIETAQPVHIDDTGARVGGVNQYCTVLCNKYFSVFFTEVRKNRLSVIKILSMVEAEDLYYLLDTDALNFLKEKGIAAHIAKKLEKLVTTEGLKKDAFEKYITDSIPNLKPSRMLLIEEVAALAFYQQNKSCPQIICLVCDDAKQFHSITLLRALCWIHEERHYQKLTPYLEYNRNLVEKFRNKIWDYYKQLKKYKENPTEAEKKRLSLFFDVIFSEKTGYNELDKRIQLTKEKKENLLVVLDHPETPLHNNPAELAVRQYVIKRKISFGTRTQEGTKSWETFFSIMDTCRKLKVHFRDYLRDRITKKHEMPSLASLIPRPPQPEG